MHWLHAEQSEGIPRGFRNDNSHRSPPLWKGCQLHLAVPVLETRKKLDPQGIVCRLTGLRGNLFKHLTTWKCSKATLMLPNCYFCPPFLSGQHTTTLPISRKPSACTQLCLKAVSCFGFSSPAPLPRLPFQDRHHSYSLPKPELHHHLSFRNTCIAHRAPDAPWSASTPAHWGALATTQ